ncbi:CRISPR-associated protein Csx16 [Gallibacterium anatis]|uniref:CRISPR-associated protein n=1 Tax=Gallibacterium anatis 12656/12 TaxID=1195244 RepID=U1GY98_9PAST|nr:CRISPR-associated protein Csx16 [Gallibacterium anatis]ERF77488.1 CRISPR-associated protein [Gallibacterium anatis 12656/12]
MTTWFISRHPGAIEWAKQQQLKIDRWESHLDNLNEINEGDIVMGTLPIHIAAEVCKKGAKFYFLSIDLPINFRGKELDREQMLNLESSLIQYYVQKYHC